MKELATVDPWTLPRVKISQVNRLPDTSGLYFVFCSSELLYIGRTRQGFRSRWRQHHRQDLKRDDRLYVAYLEYSGDDLPRLESVAISLFRPTMNGVIPGKGVKRKAPTPKDKETTEYWWQRTRSPYTKMCGNNSFEAYLELGCSIEDAIALADEDGDY